MYDTSIDSVLVVRPSISNVAGKSLTVIDAALKHASAEIQIVTNKFKKY